MASDDARMLGHRETGAPREPLCVRIERLSTGRAALAWIFVACSCAGGRSRSPGAHFGRLLRRFECGRGVSQRL